MWVYVQYVRNSSILCNNNILHIGIYVRTYVHTHTYVRMNVYSHTYICMYLILHHSGDDISGVHIKGDEGSDDVAN